MYYPKIYQSVNEEAGDCTFYLQSSGKSTGQPSLMAKLPCITIKCPNQEMFEFYYWLSESLYQAGQLIPVEPSSTEPILKIEEVQMLITGMAETMYPLWNQHQLIVGYLKSIKAARAAFSEYIVSAEKQQEFLQGIHF